jgi:hypothetical protein
LRGDVEGYADRVARRNRVTPTGDLVDAGHGLVFGNRGCLHGGEGEIRRPFQGRRWIACRLVFRGRRRELLRPGRYTELFFLDEATAWAAGHRPCRECRYADYQSFLEAWQEIHPRDDPRAGVIDDRLHAERVDPVSRAQRRHTAPFAPLPDGAFALVDGEPHVVHGDSVLRWTPTGYGSRQPRPGGTATVLTPPSLVAVLAAGWRGGLPLFHPSAG